MVKELLKSHLFYLENFVDEISKFDEINNVIFFIYRLEEDRVKLGSPLRSNSTNSSRLESSIRYIGLMGHEKNVCVGLWEQNNYEKRIGLVKLGIGVDNDEHFNEVCGVLCRLSNRIENRITNPYQFDFKLK